MRTKQQRRKNKKRQRTSKAHSQTETASDDENGNISNEVEQTPVLAATGPVVSAKGGRPKKIQKVHREQAVINQMALPSDPVPNIVKGLPIGAPPAWAEVDALSPEAQLKGC